MATELKLTILAPERRLVENEIVTEVTLPTAEGQIQILPGHVPLIGVLETGRFQYKTAAGSVTQGVISSGFFQVVGDRVSVMSETLELEGEIDVQRAKKAQAQAEEMLKSADLDSHAYRKYELKLQRALIRQSAGAHEEI